MFYSKIYLFPWKRLNNHWSLLNEFSFPFKQKLKKDVCSNKNIIKRIKQPTIKNIKRKDQR